VTTPGGTAASPVAFVVIPPAPLLDSFFPLSGEYGTAVTLRGSDLETVTEVHFGGVLSTKVRVVAGGNVVAEVPQGAQTGPISVTTPSGSARSRADFTVLFPEPVIQSFTPGRAPRRADVVISGTGFVDVSAVHFGVFAASFRMATESKIVATVPDQAVTAPIHVTTPGGRATTRGDFVVLLTPELSSFSPDRGPVGSTVTVQGGHLHDLSEVLVNGTPADFVVHSDTRVELVVPRRATTGPITLIGPAGSAESSRDFVVTEPPALLSFTPGIGIVGTPVTISGTGFLGTTRIEFDGTQAPVYTILNDSTILTLVPLGARTGPIRVTTPRGTGTSSTDFVVIGL
jgi:hypothetical protein